MVFKPKYFSKSKKKDIKELVNDCIEKQLLLNDPKVPNSDKRIQGKNGPIRNWISGDIFTPIIGNHGFWVEKYKTSGGQSKTKVLGVSMSEVNKGWKEMLETFQSDVNNGGYDDVMDGLKKRMDNPGS
jgi:hypothetical protein